MNLISKSLAGMALLVASLGGPVQAAAMYDASNDFSIGSNPNGAWTYGYSAAGGAAYALIDFDRIVNVPEAIGWGSQVNIVSNAPLIWKNISATPLFGALPGQVVLHPGFQPLGDFAVLRFIAPAAGSFNIASTFFTGDIGDTDARVILNGDFTNPLGFFNSTTNDVSFNSILNLAAGDTLDFVVGNKGGHTSDNTPVSVIISQSSGVPEPKTLMIMVMGLGLLGLSRRIKTLNQQPRGSD